MRENIAFIVWFSVLCVSCALIAIGLVVEVIAIHAGPGGWIQ